MEVGDRRCTSHGRNSDTDPRYPADVLKERAGCDRLKVEPMVFVFVNIEDLAFHYFDAQFLSAILCLYQLP
jgi:hypothetical protein